MLNIYGLFITDSMPVVQLLDMGFANEDHVNHIEIARNWFHKSVGEGRAYDAILVITGYDQCQVYTFK